MVGGSKIAPNETVKEFVLIPKKDYQAPHTDPAPDRRVLNQTVAASQPTEVPPKPPSEDIPKSELDDYSIVCKEVYAQLEAITGTKQSDNKTWKTYKTILNAILDSPILDIQLHNLEITVNGQPVDELKASTLISNLTRHNKKLAPTKYLHVLPHLASLASLGVVSNKFAKEFWSTLNGSNKKQQKQTGKGKKEKKTREPVGSRKRTEPLRHRIVPNQSHHGSLSE